MKRFSFIGIALIVAIALSLSGCSKKTDTADNGAAAGDNGSTGSSAASEISLSDLVKKADSMTSYMYTYSIDSNGKASDYTIYVKDKKLRMDFSGESEDSKISYIVDGKSILMYNKSGKMATKMKYDSESDPTEGLRPYSVTNVVDKDSLDTMNRIGRESVNGIDCDVYEYSVSNIGSNRMYVSREYGVLIRMVSSDADKKDVMTYEIKEMKVGDVDDSVFELPKGTKITDLSTMGS